jgi:hypothetical protein
LAGQLAILTGQLSSAMQSFTVASRDCAFIASVQQAEKVRLEEEEKKKEAVGVGPFRTPVPNFCPFRISRFPSPLTLIPCLPGAHRC